MVNPKYAERGAELRALRKSHGISMKEAAEQSMTPYRTWMSWEHGTVRVPGIAFMWLDRRNDPRCYNFGGCDKEPIHVESPGCHCKPDWDPVACQWIHDRGPSDKKGPAISYTSATA